MKDRTPTQAATQSFTPVPRRHRHDGWTPKRQQAFIEALAETGSVSHAAARINMATEGAYQLRLAPGAEEFRAAWETALDHGVQRLEDAAMERALHGVARPVFGANGQIGERREYNDRLLMFMLRHRQPDRYGKNAPAQPDTKHPDTVAHETALAHLTRHSTEEEVEARLAKVNKYYEERLKLAEDSKARGDEQGYMFYIHQITAMHMWLTQGCDTIIMKIGISMLDYARENRQLYDGLVEQAKRGELPPLK